MPKPSSKNWLYLLLIIPSTVVLSLHAYIGSYTRFIADDYCEAFFSRNLGLLRNIWYWYSNFEGRYSEFAGNYVLALAGTKGYPFLPSLEMISWGTIIILAVFWLQPKETRIKLWQATCLGVVLLFSMLLLTPYVDQSLYWWAGVGAHALPLVGFTVSLSIYLWCRARTFDRKGVILLAGLSFVLAFINGGFSETFTATQIVFLFLWMLWLFLRKELNFHQPGPFYLASSLAGGLVALVVVIISPGNATRQSFFTQTMDIFTILQISFSGYLAFFGKIFTTPEKWIGWMGILLVFFWFGKQTPPERIIKIWEPFAILLSGLTILVFASFTPGAYGLSDIVPERAQIIPAFFLLLTTISAAFLWGNQRGTAGEHLKWLGVAVVLIILAAGINAKNIFNSRDVYITYAQSWDQNEQKILSAVASGEKTVVITPIYNWAGLNEPNDNPKFFVNYCMSKYYGINILAKSTTP